jgi:hypothetical protein
VNAEGFLFGAPYQQWLGLGRLAHCACRALFQSRQNGIALLRTNRTLFASIDLSADALMPTRAVVQIAINESVRVSG